MDDSQPFRDDGIGEMNPDLDCFFKIGFCTVKGSDDVIILAHFDFSNISIWYQILQNCTINTCRQK